MKWPPKSIFIWAPCAWATHAELTVVAVLTFVVWEDQPESLGWWVPGAVVSAPVVVSLLLLCRPEEEVGKRSVLCVSGHVIYVKIADVEEYNQRIDKKTLGLSQPLHQKPPPHSSQETLPPKKVPTLPIPARPALHCLALPWLALPYPSSLPLPPSSPQVNPDDLGGELRFDLSPQDTLYWI
ncbi:hypothetical protein E2C01_064850 [Portunus trituberculatus]|uniref:Uncharacterized protein n=1 Tax=Portunus trituberculatus TaxID=210409 RepID=A0A5B7HKY4_PORTR|nr:hypothetical protein [Portunus trituberculatus]